MKRILVLMGITLFSLSACDSQETGSQEEVVRPVKIAQVQSASLSRERIFPGITEATRKATLAFRVSGQVVELPIHAGQRLKEGDLIARLDASVYQNTLLDRKAKYELAKTEYNRQKVLFEQKHVAKSRLDEAYSTFEAAHAAYKLAEDDVAYTKLHAPYDGVVSRKLIDNFQNVQAKEPVVQFQGADAIDITFDVPESLFQRLTRQNTGDEIIRVRFDTKPDQLYLAKYSEHETLPDSETRSFKVTATMAMPTDLTVLQGMSVDVIVDVSSILEQGLSGFLIPLEAVFDVDNVQYVWVVGPEGRVEKRKITVADLMEDQIRITDGLKEGEQVVAVGVSYISEGQKVRPLVKERGL